MIYLSWLAICASFLAINVFAAPVIVNLEYEELEARELKFAISNREWKSYDPNGVLEEWHFGLILHEQGAIVNGPLAGSYPLYHVTISKRGTCMFYEQSKNVKANAAVIKATANLLPAQGETTEEQLSQNIGAIFSGIRSTTTALTKFTKETAYMNCLDFTEKGMKALKTANYVTDADYEKFRAVRDELHAEVRKATHPLIMDCVSQASRRDFDDQLEGRAVACRATKGKSAALKAKKSKAATARTPTKKAKPASPSRGKGKKAGVANTKAKVNGKAPQLKSNMPKAKPGARRRN